MRSSALLVGCDATTEWKRALAMCLDYGNIIKPRGHETLEVLNHSSIIGMSQPTVGSIKRRLSYTHMANEALWILSGDSRLSTISKTAPSYEKYSDDGIFLQGAYGPIVVSQMRYVVETLTEDPESRQAVMSLWRPNPRKSRDIPCTVSMQFLIRDLKLHCVTNMRSSDAWLGFPYDVFCFTMISQMLLLMMGSNSIGLGRLFLNVGSQHLYEKDREKAILCLNEVVDLKFEPMSSYGLDTPDDLLLALGTIVDDSEDSKSMILPPHFESMREYAQTHQ